MHGSFSYHECHNDTEETNSNWFWKTLDKQVNLLFLPFLTEDWKQNLMNKIQIFENIHAEMLLWHALVSYITVFKDIHTICNVVLLQALGSVPGPQEAVNKY